MKQYQHHHHPKKSAHISEVFLKNITRLLPQYIFWKNTHSVYLGCNENYARLVGLRSPEEILGKTDFDLHWQPSGHTAEVFQQGDQDTLNGHPITNQQETLVLPDGKKLMTLVSKLPIVDDDGDLLGIVGYFTDITALKDKERELRLAKQQADAANQAKSIFLTNMSHDLRTPLSGLLGMASVMAQEIHSQQGKAAVQDLIRAGGQLLNLLNELIEFSKCEAGDLPIYDVKFSLKALVDNVMALQTPAAQEKQLRFHLVWDDHLPATVIGDATRFQRILLNLVSNAIKFTDRGSVTVGLRQTSCKNRRLVIECWVQDTGIGIPIDKQSVIFSRFSRLHPAYQTRYPGTGLGLALVKQFIEDLDGEIDVKSVSDQGSTFTFLIPLKMPLSEETRSDQWVIQPHANDRVDVNRELDAQQKKILVVEDHPIVQKAVKHQLESFGVQVETANNGAEALTLSQATLFHLVVMDIGLPDQDGYAVAVSIHEWQYQHQQTPSVIVALSAHQDEQQKRRCQQAGIVKSFSKPLDPQKVQEILALMDHPIIPLVRKKSIRHPSGSPL